jgi:hypothetical protein
MAPKVDSGTWQGQGQAPATPSHWWARIWHQARMLKFIVFGLLQGEADDAGRGHGSVVTQGRFARISIRRS